MSRSVTVRRSSPSDTIVWSSERPWWQRYDVANAEYLSWEADAHRVHEWAALRVPDLLHTPQYTRALLLGDRAFRAEHMVGGELDDAGARRVRDEIGSREERQGRLRAQASRPLEYRCVIEEAALRRVVGRRETMHEQVIELLGFAGCRSVTLRVVPEKARAQPDTDGGFALLEFPDPALAPLMFAHYPGGVVCESDPRVIERARQRLDAVLALALPEPDSIEFLQQVADQLYSG